MKAILLNGHSHGCLLHAVPDDLPEWTNVHDETYTYIQPFILEPTQIALYSHGNPNLNSKTVQSIRNIWKRLLSEPNLFSGSKSFKRAHRTKKHQTHQTLIWGWKPSPDPTCSAALRDVS